MKCQILFPGEKKKRKNSTCLQKILPRVLTVKKLLVYKTPDGFMIKILWSFVIRLLFFV